LQPLCNFSFPEGSDSVPNWPMAPVSEPTIRSADEPTIALDVTRQAQMPDLIREIRRRKAQGVTSVAHGFGVAGEKGSGQRPTARDRGTAAFACPCQ